MHFSPGGQLSAVRVREAATKTAPQRFHTLRFAHLYLLTCRRRGFRSAARRISEADRFTRTRFTTWRQRRDAMPTVPFADPPLGSFAFHTSLPVSAFIANTQPRFVAT